MKLKLIFSITLFTLVFMSCSEDNSLFAPKILAQKTNYQLDFEEAIVLNPEIENLTETTINWLLNDEIVSTEPTYTFLSNSIGENELKLVVENSAGKETLIYNIRVFGKYAEGVFIVSASSENDNGTVGFLKDSIFTSKVFQLENPDKTLGFDLISGQISDNKLYFVSQSGTNYITVTNAETLKLEETISTSEARNPAYISLVDNDKAYILSAYSSTRLLYNVDFTNAAIQNKIDGISDIPAIQSAVLAIENKLLIADGNSVKEFDTTTESVNEILTFSDNVSGIVTDANNNIWIATEGRNEEATFVKLNADLSIAETVKLGTDVKLYRNGMLTSANSKYFYWQETSTGNIHRFNNENKTQELFITPFNYNLFFTTALKIHPKTEDIYLAGVTDFFDMSNSVMLIFNEEGQELNKFENIGTAPTDFVFNYKELYQ
ncbi:DUF5074 domain-containing protein [Lutibacter sp. A80]|uniref:DUF5074 domain-containing protein n=1 Tax=Lutibacter sp. A80 TaxID=2918453 RepID=UPI001F05633C|nr:DUF5074 domain-containing protein [Lutibacter sp. A80]UMB61063.1 DUF5074 domain-containing protein [Lutibacter sp. A80]